MYIATNIYKIRVLNPWMCSQHLLNLMVNNLCLFKPRASSPAPPAPNRCVALVAVCFMSLLLLLIVFLNYEKLVSVSIFCSDLQAMIGKCLAHFGALLGLMEIVSYAIYIELISFHSCILYRELIQLKWSYINWKVMCSI